MCLRTGSGSVRLWNPLVDLVLTLSTWLKQPDLCFSNVILAARWKIESGINRLGPGGA